MVNDEISAVDSGKENPLPSVNSTSSTRRVYSLDALRGIAAIGVVLLHFTTDFHKFFSPTRKSAFDFYWGAYGVHLFFIISGFVILMSAERAKSARGFIASRFSRLYPPYWVAIIFTLCILVFFPLGGGIGSDKLWHRAIVNFTMFQSWVGVGSIDSVYWTLQVEMSFYIVMVILIAKRAVDNVLPVMLVLVVVSILDHLLVLRPIGAIYSYIRQMLFLEHAYLFTTGIVLYKMRSGFKSTYLLMLIICVCSPATANFFPNTPPRDAAIFVALAIIFYLATNARLNWLISRPLIFLGGISYSLYLTHHWLGFLLLKKADEEGMNPNLALLSAIVACIVVASMSTYLIEKPSLRWLRARRHSARQDGSLAATRSGRP